MAAYQDPTHMCAHRTPSKWEIFAWTQTKSVSQTIISFVPWCGRVWRRECMGVLAFEIFPFFSQWRSAKHMYRLRLIRDIIWRAAVTTRTREIFRDTFSGRCGWCKIIQQIKETNFRVCFDNNFSDAERSHYTHTHTHVCRSHSLRRRWSSWLRPPKFSLCMIHCVSVSGSFLVNCMIKLWPILTQAKCFSGDNGAGATFYCRQFLISDEFQCASPHRRFTSHTIDVRYTFF